MAILSNIAEIWNIIVKSNTFNFIFFVLILVWIFNKVNIKAIISSLQEKIIKIINEAKKEKEDAQNAFKNAEKAVEHLGEELHAIVEDAQKSARAISEKILSEAQKHIATIEANKTKVIDAEEKLFIAKLTKTTSLASLETAEKYIKDTLEQNPALHEQYINESIEELDRLNF